MTADPSHLATATRLSQHFATLSNDFEQQRRIPAEVSAQLAEAGFYRLFIPQDIGGLEASPRVASEVFEQLAQGDAACAWVAFIGATGGYALSRIKREDAAAVFSHQHTLIAGAYAPTGSALACQGGYQVNGRWQWGSGTENAQWVLGGCRLQYASGQPLLADTGAPRMQMCLFPAADIQFLDTWHVAGLQGTGSTDYQVSDVFVPEGHVVGLNTADYARGPLYLFPQYTLLALGVAAVSLGIARAAIDALVDLAASKKRAGSSKTLADRSHTQMEVARAEAQLRSARAFYYDSIDTAWNRVCKDGELPLEMRRDIRLATTHAVEASVKAVDAMYTLGGGSAVYTASPLQRHFRDIHVATQHIMVASSTLETVGRLYLGVEANIDML